MFLQDFKIMDVPYDDVVARLSRDTRGVLGEALDSTRRQGERMRVRVAPASWPAPLAKSVEILAGEVRNKDSRTSVNFGWRATSGSSLFPRLEADLEAAPFGLDQTSIVLHGRYEPPGGALGRGADQLLLHRFAEATLRAFLEGICERLCGQVGGRHRS